MTGITRHRTVTLHRHRKPDMSQAAAETIERDLRVAGGCVPKFLGAPGACKDKWGNVVRPDAREAMTINHVRQHPGGGRPSIPRWMNAGCWFHNVQGWELTHTPELRDYLAQFDVIPHG